jgi:hypothetical protein
LGPFLFHIGLGFASDLHEKTDPRAPKRLPRLTICGLLTNIVVVQIQLSDDVFKKFFRHCIFVIFNFNHEFSSCIICLDSSVNITE